jgi:hypothetical protein
MERVRTVRMLHHEHDVPEISDSVPNRRFKLKKDTIAEYLYYCAHNTETSRSELCDDEYQ